LIAKETFCIGPEFRRRWGNPQCRAIEQRDIPIRYHHPGKKIQGTSGIVWQEGDFLLSEAYLVGQSQVEDIEQVLDHDRVVHGVLS
jgi:hypothetical protein